MNKKYHLVLLLLFISLIGNGQSNEFLGQTFSIKSADGLDVKADYYPIADKSSPLILLFHQARYSRGEYRPIAPLLNDLGFACIAIDQRSGNEVQGIINETHQQAEEKGFKTTYVDALPDLEALVDYCLEQYPSRKLIVWGSSYSSALAFVLGSKYKSQISAILSFSPGEYFTYKDKTIPSYAAEVHCPVFITSSKDEESRWQSIYEAIPSTDKVGFVPEKEGKHGSKALWKSHEGNEEYWVAVKAFLMKLK